MSVIFGYSREAVRVKVKKCEGLHQPEFRKFSVDPQITSFEVLQSILGKAFDIKGEFTICYRTYDVVGHETYLPLLSDWDLDAAFLKAHNTSVVTGSEPCLCLRVDMKPFEETSDDWDGPSTVSVITQFRTGTAQEVKPSQRLPGLIMNQVERTFNMVQKAFNLGEDVSTVLQHPPRPPLSDSEFRKFLDPVGQIMHTKDLRSVIYLGGIDPSLRKVVWKHILNVYPDGMCGRERMDYIKRKAAEYICLRDAWKDVLQRGPVTGDLAYTTSMVRKDVLRTDRHHKFYAGSDDNQNIASLFNILTTYALNHPKVSYCQGMSDLASPLLVTMGDESHAYICFCALMTRLSCNFMLDGIAMTQKFTHLAEGIMYYDPEFYNYLKSHQADDLLFCYRWLLLEMKREFAFEDSLRMLEVLWSSLPSSPPEKELKLFETRFLPPVNNTPPVSPLIKTPRENAYTKVCMLRRQTSSISLASYMGNKIPTVKRQNFSLDENVCRLTKSISDTKYRSLDDAMVGLGGQNSKDHHNTIVNKSVGNSSESEIDSSNNTNSRPRSVSPLEAKSDSQVVLNNRINNSSRPHLKTKSILSSSMSNLINKNPIKKPGHFKDLKDRIAQGKIGIFSSLDKLDSSNSIKEEGEVFSDRKPMGSGSKIVRNLNEFLNFTSPTRKSNSSESDNPVITLTSSNTNGSKSRNPSNRSDSCTDDTFDGSSPDDSQEYFPMTTSMTRELRLELENLDRQVFGNKYNQHVNLDDSDSCSNESSLENKTKTCDCIVSKSDIMLDNQDETMTEVAEIGSTPKLDLKFDQQNQILPSSNVSGIQKSGVNRRTDDIFVWENPLHQSSPSLTTKAAIANLQTPDEQADLEFDDPGLGDLIDESKGGKSVTPIKLVRKTQKSCKKLTIANNISATTVATTNDGVNLNTAVINKEEPRKIPEISVNGGLPPMTNSCEEITEIKNPGTNLLPPPHEFGGRNPFLMFLCLTVLLQHREVIMRNAMDYNEMAMHFDKMVRKHNVNRVLNQARQMYTGYIKQHTIAQTQSHPHVQHNGGEFA